MCQNVLFFKIKMLNCIQSLSMFKYYDDVFLSRKLKELSINYFRINY